MRSISIKSFSFFILLLFLLTTTSVFAQDSSGVRCRARLTFPFNITTISAVSNYLYVGGGAGLRILDISEPINPIEVGSYDTSRYISCSIVIGDYLFYSRGTQFVCADIHNRLEPIATDSINLPGTEPFRFVTRSESRIFAVSSNCVVRIIVSSSRWLSCEGAANVPSPLAIAANGNTVFVSSMYGYGMIHIFDFNRQVPFVRSQYYEIPIYGLSVSNNLLFAGNVVSGVRVFSLARPDSISLINTFIITGSPYDILVSDDSLAYIAASVNGLRVYNVADPMSPIEIGYYGIENGRRVERLTKNGLLVIGYYENTATLFDCSQLVSINNPQNPLVPEEMKLEVNYPNPFNATTTIEYTIPKTGKVDLKVFDITGREVATLVNFHQNPGAYQVKFDGTTLATGTYFLRLQVGEFVKTQKMVILK